MKNLDKAIETAIVTLIEKTVLGKIIKVVFTAEGNSIEDHLASLDAVRKHFEAKADVFSAIVELN